MRNLLTIAGAVALAITAWGGLGGANAMPRLHYGTTPERTGYYGRHYGYPRPYCTFAIREYQRAWPPTLWPPSMRCFPYPY
jgi:hypothetical protein